MPLIDEQLLNDIVNSVKRELLANRQFISSLLKEIKLTPENIDVNLILKLMAATSNYKTPPVPKTNKPSEVMNIAEGDVCSKPITIGANTLAAKIVADLLVGNNVYLFGKAGTGKAQPYYSKLLTPTGWTTMGDIKIGDLLISDDGKPTEVDGVFERGIKKVFRVYMSDGSFTDTCDEHLWEVRNSRQQTQKISGKVIPLKEIRLKMPKGRNDAFIPVVKPVQFKSKKHIIDPYLLGALIGDGCMMAGYPSITSIDNGILERISSLLPKDMHLNKFKVYEGKAAAYSIVKKKRNSIIKNVITEELKRLGLMYKKALDKFIPDEYLFDSVENRVKLLQGLMDTDGTASKTHVEFDTSSEKLKNDFVELVQSLGGTCNVAERMPKYIGKSGQLPALSYRIVVKLPNEIVPFSLKRKASVVKARTKYFPSRSIQKVEYLGDMPTKCISVKSKSHLYVTDDYIVTHNTYLAKAIAECILHQDAQQINCSQWTSPIEIRGGQTITGYKEGVLIIGWANGSVLILDELPKLDPNTAGLLNEALAETAAMPKYDKEGKVIAKTIPYITNGRGQRIYKGEGLRAVQYAARSNKAQSYPAWYEEQVKNNALEEIAHEFRFSVIATGNTDMKTVSNKYSGNQRQDYSLVDRFAGSFYEVVAEKETEMQLIYPYVYRIADAMRSFLNTRPDAIESISLRTMLNFNRTYEQDMLASIASPFADKVFDNAGKKIKTTKTLKDAVDSFVNGLPDDLRKGLLSFEPYTEAIKYPSQKDEFKTAFIDRYNLDPETEQPVVK